MNKSKAIIIIFAIALILGAVLVFPKYQELVLLQSRVDQKQEELEGREDYFTELREISARLQEYSDELAKVDAALPLNSDFSDVLRFLERTGAESGLLLSGIGDIETNFFVPPQEEELFFEEDMQDARQGVKENTLTISFIGRYPDFKYFLSALESSARLISLERIAFSRDVQVEEEGGLADIDELINFILSLKFYSY